MKKSINFNTIAAGGNELAEILVGNFNIAKLEGTILAGDVGGTKSYLALFELQKGELNLLKQQTFSTKEQDSFEGLLRSFHIGEFTDIDVCCIGIAGPVTNGRAEGTNFGWDIDGGEISRKLGIPSVEVINDMEANAYGLATLSHDEFEEIKPGSNLPGNRVIISPGTGLGEAGLFWDGAYLHPFATEGGHCEFCPRSEFDLELWSFIKDMYGPVSWERLVSGPGIFNIYKFLVHKKKITEPDWFKKRLANEDPSSLISHCAAESDYVVCKETIDVFTRYLAVETCQMALKMKATGGIYLGGGILPKNLQNIDKELFIHNFLECDRMEPLLEQMSVRMVLNNKTALYGAAIYAIRSLKAIREG